MDLDAILEGRISREDDFRGRLDARLNSLRLERREGRGLQLQRRLLTEKLNSVAGFEFSHFSWDESGRRIVSEAAGIEAIVLSHIATIFASSEVDVLVCSVCGTPYPFDEAGQGRRPRYGVRRFCSDDCRKQGKRESNRLSWRRNSSRWRSRTSPTDAEKGARDGKTS